MSSNLLDSRSDIPVPACIGEGRHSLDICSLSELVDKYHTYKATERHDKIYALLGMSSDDLSVAGLQLKYNTPWKKLMLNLVKF
jgi:hypothetical protein